MIKTKIYDQFHCIADQCPLTCCKGWAIRADGGIYEKWKSRTETSYLCEQVTYNREDGENIYHMKRDPIKIKIFFQDIPGCSCYIGDDRILCS